MKRMASSSEATKWAFVSLLAISALIVSNKYPHSQSKTTSAKEKSVTRSLLNPIHEAHTDEHFFKWSFKGHRPSTPNDTVGTTSFRLFDKTKHVSNEFQFPSKLMSSRTEGTLDFVIAGFPKCGKYIWLPKNKSHTPNSHCTYFLDYQSTGVQGTTFMMNYMGHDDDIKMLHSEQCQFFKGYGTGYKGPKELMEGMETMHNHELTDREKLSFKCPNAIVDEAFDEIMSSYYPTTGIIIGIRHPVQLFRSFYNFRIKRKKHDTSPMPLVHELIGSNCHHKNMVPVCTDFPKYALALSKLGKTDLREVEVDLLASMVYEKDPHHKRKKNAITEYLTNFERPKMGRIFLYALEQMGDEDEGRVNKFVEDLSSFVGLDHTMERPPEHEAAPLSGSSTDGKRGLRRYYADMAKEGGKWEHKYQTDEMRQEVESRHKKMQIDICDDLYDDVRELLVKEGALTAKWIRKYFLEAEDVVVSQRDHFESILDSFSVDPCVHK